MWLTVAPEGGGTTISFGTETRITEPFAQVFMAAEWVGTHPPGEQAHGRITARNPVTAELTWDKRYDIIPHSALMSTASGLIFNGTWRVGEGAGRRLLVNAVAFQQRRHNGGSSPTKLRRSVCSMVDWPCTTLQALFWRLYRIEKLINYQSTAALITFALRPCLTLYYSAALPIASFSALDTSRSSNLAPWQGPQLGKAE